MGDTRKGRQPLVQLVFTSLLTGLAEAAHFKADVTCEGRMASNLLCLWVAWEVILRDSLLDYASSPVLSQSFHVATDWM